MSTLRKLTANDIYKGHYTNPNNQDQHCLKGWCEVFGLKQNKLYRYFSLDQTLPCSVIEYNDNSETPKKDIAEVFNECFKEEIENANS